MLIIKILLKITGFNQEQLATYLGVSRATVNYWINGETISESSKRIISEKFNFPIRFFDASLDENIEIYKIIYATIYNNWEKLYKNQVITEEEKINRILNEIEMESKSIYIKEINDDDIIDGLINGYNPFTGEIFDESHILSNTNVKRIMRTLLSNKSENNKFPESVLTYDGLSNDKKIIYDKLRCWRLEQTKKEEFPCAFMVFSNKTLINIIESEINEISDLLKVKGIGKTKYEKYANDIFEILNEENENGSI